jgi:hypothetical protein
MQIQMNGRNPFKRLVRWSDVFLHVQGLRFYLLLKSVAMVKDGVQFREIMLTKEQYVRSIHLLRANLWLYNVKKMDLYIHFRIQRTIKLLEKLGLKTAERFPHGFLFTILAVNGRKQAEINEASTAEEQLKNRHHPFFLPAREPDVKNSRIESKDTIEKRNKREKRKNYKQQQQQHLSSSPESKIRCCC